MLKVGVTGGIGSGKTVVCRIFRVLGIPVFDADTAAKKLMQHDRTLAAAIREAFGDEAYLPDGGLNRTYLSAKVFTNREALERLNALVHPAAIKAANDWAALQHAPYTVKEAALLFESGSYRHNDVNILVTAPEAVRILRVMQRDGITEDQVKARMARQLSDDVKTGLADYIIVNDDKTAIIPQVLALHERFIS